MQKGSASLFLNIIFFTAVCLIAVSVATIALTKKVNEYRNDHQKDIQATVIKQVIPVLSYSRGVVKKVAVKNGQDVKKNEILVELDNPSLKSKIEALEQYPDNISAQTESKVAIEELKNLKVSSPVDGVVEKLIVTEGAPVDSLSAIMVIYSNSNVRLLARLTNEQFQVIQQLKELYAYSPRLNQSFVITPDVVKPDQETDPQNIADKKIGVYFNLKNADDGSSLLHNEDLSLSLETGEGKISKPIDYFVDFWNGLLARKENLPRNGVSP